MIPFKDTLGACSAWGDPHIRTFDGQQLDVYGVGKYVFVRFEEVEITVPDNYFDPGAAQSGNDSNFNYSDTPNIYPPKNHNFD